jgi:hypothetical protein
MDSIQFLLKMITEELLLSSVYIYQNAAVTL